MCIYQLQNMYLFNNEHIQILDFPVMQITPSYRHDCCADSSLHEKFWSVGQNQQNFILTDSIFYSVRQMSGKSYQNYNDNV